MSIDRIAQNPTQLQFEFMKPEPKTSSSKFGRNLALGVTGLSLLAAVSVAWSKIPENPPNVHVSVGSVDIEPYTYSGDYLTRFADGSATLMLVGGFYHGGPYRWIKANSLGLVYSVEGDVGEHIRDKQLSADSEQVFADAQAKLDEVVKKYKPYI